MSKIVRHIRSKRLLSLIDGQHEFYEQDWTPAKIRDWQLNEFNRQWKNIRQQVPFFEKLEFERNLPKSFSSWDEFKALMPEMDRKTVQQQRSLLANRATASDFLRTTGGSTAEPIRIPGWNSELQIARQDMWYARSWYGVNPSDRLFLIWGHSHLLGKGIRGRVNGFGRIFKDKALGYYRYSAYDMSEEGLRRAAKSLLKFKPSYIIGYSAALDRFARINASLKSQFHELKLKVAIATGESFPKSSSLEFVKGVLGCQVVMEYGTVEAGAIAHQRKDHVYSIFWRHYFVEGYEFQDFPGAYEILVTSLYPRCFALVRYKTGDLISANPNNPDFKQEFESVIGRCNDFIELNDGVLVHSEAFTHAVKESPAITDFQVVQSPDGQIRLKYVSPKRDNTLETNEVKRRLIHINPHLQNVQMEQVQSLEQTIAGKTRRIIRETK